MLGFVHRLALEARARLAARVSAAGRDMPARASAWVPLLMGAWAEGLIVICLILSGLRLVYGLEAAVDLGLFDETGYLYAGTHLPSFGLMPPVWAPLYGVWYYLLSRLQPEPIALYYLNYKLLTIGAPALIYLLLRAYELPRFFALPAAWFFLISAANLPVWPKPGTFALCLLLLLLIVARALRTPPQSALLLGVGALLCSYVRPEYLLASALLFGLYFALLWRRRGQWNLRGELVQLSIALALAFGLASIFGLAPLDRNNNRSFEAFAQHYAINWAAWSGQAIDPWTEYDLAIASSFGPVQSLGEAVRANPVAVARHLGTNLVNYPVVLGQTFLLHFNPLLPAEAEWAAPAGAWLLAGACAAALLWGAMRRREELRERWRANGHLLTSFALLAAPGLSSAIVIYPRSHYLLLHGVLLVLAAGLLFGPRAGAARPTLLWSVLAAIVFVVFTPSIGATWFAPQPPLSPHPNRSTVEAIRSLEILEPTAILEAEGGFHVYLGDHFARVGPERKTTGLKAFLRDRNIGMIVVSAKLRRDRRFADDPEWQALLADPHAAGFTSLGVPGTDRTILYRRDD